MGPCNIRRSFNSLQLQDQNFLIAYCDQFLIQRLLPFNGQSVPGVIVGVRRVGDTYEIWRIFQVSQRSKYFQG